MQTLLYRLSVPSFFVGFRKQTKRRRFAKQGQRATLYAVTSNAVVHNDQRASKKRLMKPRILILHATGTNRDREAALACELAGGAPEIVHVNRLAAGERRLADDQMLVLPGGFSYGDDLGAGKLWAAMPASPGRPDAGLCRVRPAGARHLQWLSGVGQGGTAAGER